MVIADALDWKMARPSNREGQKAGTGRRQQEEPQYRQQNLAGRRRWHDERRRRAEDSGEDPTPWSMVD